MSHDPEVWLRGPLPDVPALLQPVAHSLLQSREELHATLASVSAADVWVTPGGAASIGFHARHAAGSLDRLFTYARGEALGEAQREAAREEGNPGDPAASLSQVVEHVERILDRAMDQLRSTPRYSLLEPRKVGRAGLPSNVLGLLFHAAEHATRHVGQAITTAKILEGR